MPSQVDLAGYDQLVFNFDGNNNDKDDIAAIAIATLLTEAAGLTEKMTFFVGNNIAEFNDPQITNLHKSADFAASRGIEVVKIQNNINAAQNKLEDIFESGQNVLVFEGGPMEFTHSVLQSTKRSFHDNIDLISHSSWNENRSKVEKQGFGEANTWSDIGDDFPAVDRIDIADQNAGANNTFGFNNRQWTWMDGSDNPLIQEARTAMEGADGKVNDPSDSGMLFWTLTGKERGTALDAKAYLEPRLPNDKNGNGGSGKGNNNNGGNDNDDANDNAGNGNAGGPNPNNSLPISGASHSFFGESVGATHTAILSLADGVPERGVRLFLDIFDIDARAEATLTVNGEGVRLPVSVIAGEVGSVVLDPALLKTGENAIEFTFASDLNGTTAGYRINDLTAVGRGQPVDQPASDGGSDSKGGEKPDSGGGSGGQDVGDSTNGDDVFLLEGLETVEFFGGDDRVLSFDIDSGGEKTFNTKTFSFAGQDWSLSTEDDFLDIVRAIEIERIDFRADAYIVDGSDLELELPGLGNILFEDLVETIGEDALRDAGADGRNSPFASYPDADVLFG